MSYELPQLEEYTFNDATFGATTVVHNAIGPKGKVGFVRDILVDVQVTLVGTTTVPEIDVGTASGDFTYGRYRLGSTAILGYTAPAAKRASQEAIVGNPPRALNDYTGHVVLDGGPYGTAGSITGGSSTTVNPAGRIPADTAFFITCKAGVGAPAGGGVVKVVVEWIGQNAGG